MKRNLQHLISASALALFIFIAFGSDDEENDSTSSTTITNKDSGSKTEKTTNWKYTEDIDEMDNTKRTIAALDSDNSIKFDFPYGNSNFTLIIRNWDGKTDIYLSCSKCQFISGFSGNKTYRVKFDNEAPINVSANHSSSGSSDVVFLGSESKIISKLKNSERLIIEAEFYDLGRETITFSTKGFKWDNK
ncbi:MULTISPECIES: hypothetical protein [Mesonia]|mgnify:CR=1 FL=1|uniref:Uncharacterized protein n=1 Tax=Mesonia oceanica TaxID=2687242 RepID=A0AC61YDJ1_9FLAO|nr:MULTISPECIES: hypothetical protein [Mesonia]MAN29347.1 hypothetical protein [Mesonia sp.]MAQ41622.1 hypothetical protein [Mesonia sp.]VVV01460.1 hypothetical protein FVB9532_02752 [Mesonia oceanica]|tara:strand:+ start:3616 stop:4185 length:570 start_codon:yes stop_codon:yes gene_type:complete